MSSPILSPFLPLSSPILSPFLPLASPIFSSLLPLSLPILSPLLHSSLPFFHLFSSSLPPPESSSTESFFMADFANPVPLALVSLDTNFCSSLLPSPFIPLVSISLPHLHPPTISLSLSSLNYVSRVPQCLLFLGILEYSQELLKTLEARTHLEAGGEREVEIRGCSIWAIEVDY